MEKLRIMRKIWLLSIFLVIQASANMWISAGQAYGIEPRLLYAISKVESNVRPWVISVNYKKLSSSQSKKLYSMLRTKKIFYNTFTKVIEIDNQDINQAKGVISFLDSNHYPSFDIGLMQINSIHKKTLAKNGITLDALLDENCNLHVAAGILWNCYKKHKSTHKAINAYNGKTVGNPYYSKVFSILNNLLLPTEDVSKRLFYCVI